MLNGGRLAPSEDEVTKDEEEVGRESLTEVGNIRGARVVMPLSGGGRERGGVEEGHVAVMLLCCHAHLMVETEVILLPTLSVATQYTS